MPSCSPSLPSNSWICLFKGRGFLKKAVVEYYENHNKCIKYAWGVVFGSLLHFCLCIIGYVHTINVDIFFGFLFFSFMHMQLHTHKCIHIFFFVFFIYIIILYRPRTCFSKITRSSLKPRLSNSDIAFYWKERIFSYRFDFPTLTFDSG